MEHKVSNDFLTTMLNKWGDKWWFKASLIAIIVYFISAPIITTVITNSYQSQNISQSITSTLDDRDADASRRHRVNYEISRLAYALAKHTMGEYIPLTKSEYIFLLEFHNGSENVMTGIQFCRFDITLEVVKEEMPYVPIEKFKDDIVARYDILLSDKMASNKVQHYTQAEFEKVDKYLAYLMTYVDAKSYAIVSLKDKDGKIFGALLCISSDNDNMDLLAVRELAVTLEDVFTNKIQK